MAGLEDSGSGRATGRGRDVGFRRYQFPLEDSELLQPGLFPSLHGPVEVGGDGLPTGVELEQPADEEGAEAGASTSDPDEISAPFRPESIKIETQTTTVDLLLSRLREGMIDLAPDFQRRAGIWTDVQQSRLIESLLLRIPISSFHMAQDEKDDWAVVDGIQRLTAIARFIAPEAVDMPPLTLRGLDYLRDYHGKGYEALTGRLKIRLRETQLVVHIIQQGTPEAVKFNVFSRINTGGLPLTPQEIRHALVDGPVRGYLADLAEDSAFGDATGHSVSNERMADREMVLRFLAFRLSDPSGHAQRTSTSSSSPPCTTSTGSARINGSCWRWSSARRCVALRTSSEITRSGNGGVERGASPPSTKPCSRRSRSIWPSWTITSVRRW